MARKRRSEQLTKSVTHIRNGIRNKKWKLGEYISPVSEICRKVNVSRGTMLKAIEALCDEHMLEKYGTGYVVIGRPKIRFTTLQKTIVDIKTNLRASDMLNRGGIYDPKLLTIALRTYRTVELLRPVTKEYGRFDVEAVRSTLYNRVSAQDAIDNAKLMNVYHLQLKIFEFIDVLTAYIDELGLR